MGANELNVDERPHNAPEAHLEQFLGAVDLASDQDQMTWLVNADGKRVAAIVPVDAAEALEHMFMDEPPFNDYHHHNHAPSRPDPGCANCKYVGWLA